MQKKFFILAAAVLMSFTATFANDGKPVPAAIVQELQKEFGNISNLQWKETENFYKASFSFNNQTWEAFYSFDGQLMATSRNITMEQLPISLVKELKQMDRGYDVTDLFEMLSDKGTEYFITLKNEKETKKFKSSGYGWVRF